MENDGPGFTIRNRGVLIGNRLVKVGGIDVVAGSVVSENDIGDAPGAAITVRGARCCVEENYIANAQTGIIVLAGAAEALIDGNQIVGATTGVVVDGKAPNCLSSAIVCAGPREPSPISSLLAARTARSRRLRTLGTSVGSPARTIPGPTSCTDHRLSREGRGQRLSRSELRRGRLQGSGEGQVRRCCRKGRRQGAVPAVRARQGSRAPGRCGELPRPEERSGVLRGHRSASLKVARVYSGRRPDH